MYQHPTIAAAVAEEHRSDLIADAEAHRIARTARASRPVLARPMRIISQLIGAARRPVSLLSRWVLMRGTSVLTAFPVSSCAYRARNARESVSVIGSHQEPVAD